jgi:glycosyltransferase involved in cell wall biosynthesis
MNMPSEAPSAAAGPGDAAALVPAAATTAPRHQVSIVIPLHDEGGNVAALLAALHAALRPLAYPWELVMVDDGSGDDTLLKLKAARRQYGAHVRIVALPRNVKQTAAMQAGLDSARGNVIVTLDGDLQNDPLDIPAMIDRLIDEDLDLVAGWRRHRKDNPLLRTFPSRIANRLIGRVTGVRLNDYGCSLKVFRASVLRGVRFYGEMHRFMPAWLATVTSPARIAEVEVRHHPRHAGRSHYGLSRTLRVVIDLLSMYFFMRFAARPGHFFGGAGLIVGALGTALLGWLAVVKFGLGQEIGGRPLLLVAVLLVLAGVQLVTTGVLAEMLARIYSHSGAAPQMVTREAELASPDSAWYLPGQHVDRGMDTAQVPR